jgi:hypothetical protein
MVLVGLAGLMPWVRFLSDFDWKPKPPVTVGYLAGTTELVTRDCAADALAAGKAITSRRPADASRKASIASRISKARSQ